eukprot:5680228-Amphidinium_carterae.1
MLDTAENTTRKGPCPLSATLSEVLDKKSGDERNLLDVVTGRDAAKPKDKVRRAANKAKEKAEDLAQKFNKDLHEGVQILQFGAMRARGRQHAAADVNYPHVA